MPGSVLIKRLLQDIFRIQIWALSEKKVCYLLNLPLDKSYFITEVKKLNYIETSLAFIESKEMRDYLMTELPKSDKAADTCADIIAFAPASIERKLPVLEQIAWEIKPELGCNEESPTNRAAEYVYSCHKALAERHSGSDGSVFWLRAFTYNKAGNDFFDNAFFQNFDAGIRYLKYLQREYQKDSAIEGQNYEMTKLVPDDDGRLVEYCVWYLNDACEILWYFDDHSKLGFGGASPPIFLPVPFRPGDIVAADCRPYAAPRPVLILDIGDNLDCCSVSCLSIGKDGRLYASVFKHNGFLDSGEISQVSVLYRAAKWTGGLTAEEKPLAVLSPLIHEKPELGVKIMEYLYDRKSSERFAASWEEIRVLFTDDVIHLKYHPRLCN